MMNAQSMMLFSTFEASNYQEENFRVIEKEPKITQNCIFQNQNDFNELINKV